MLCHPEPGSAVSYALRNAKSPKRAAPVLSGGVRFTPTAEGEHRRHLLHGVRGHVPGIDWSGIHAIHGDPFVGKLTRESQGDPRRNVRDCR